MVADGGRGRVGPDGPEPLEAAGGSTGGAPAGAAGQPDAPTSILVCSACGKRNRIRANPRGVPHCGSCSATLPWVVDASDKTFAYEAAASVAVVVDLWAPWCGPCRFVSPILEQLAREFAGRLKVVKVNVDENPVLAAQFDARSIPTLVVLRGGRVVDRIVGALPKTDLTVRLTPHLLRTA
ncbi:MAG TPA: thioredoxin [Candidatus Limnocylindrales bacterium]